MDHRGGRSDPLWESWNVVPEGSVVDFVNKNAEEGGGLVTEVGLKLRVDLDDERGGDGGKQTGLISWLESVQQNFKLHVALTKLRVVFKSSSYFLRNSLSYSSATLR